MRASVAIEEQVEQARGRYLAELRAAKDEMIGELRRRADVAEVEADALRLRLAEVDLPPVVVVAGREAPETFPTPRTTSEAHRPVERLWRHLRRVWRRG